MSNKPFTAKSHVRRHKRVILEKIRFRCDKCNKEYKAKEALARHTKSNHGNGSLEMTPILDPITNYSSAERARQPKAASRA